MNEQEIKAAFEIWWKKEFNVDEFPLTIQEYPMGKGWSYCDHNTHRSWLSFRDGFALGISHQTRKPDTSTLFVRESSAYYADENGTPKKAG